MKPNPHFSIAGILLIIATFIELGYQSFWLGANGIYWSPIIWLLSGVACCFFALSQVKEKSDQIILHPVSKVLFLEDIFANKRITLLIYGFLFIVGSTFIGLKLQGVFEKYPIDPLLSDGIPSMEMYVKRFISGEKVYTQMYFPSWSFFPTYLPFMWSPYIPAEVLNIDYRWTAYFFFLIVLVFWNKRLLNQPIYFEEALLKLVIPFIMMWCFIKDADFVFGHALELTPISYYLILALSLGSSRVWMVALPILFCLLSRYAFSFWLPIYLLILWSEFGFKKAFQIGILVGAGVFIFYLLPFISGDWSIITKGVDAYNIAIIDQWKTQPWQESGALPHHLSQGLSFSIYFYNLLPDLSVLERLSMNKWAHLLLSLGTAIMILLSYFWYKKKFTNFNLKLFLLISLKFYLVIFYSLMYMPFSYLYKLPLFLSIPIIYETVILRVKSQNE